MKKNILIISPFFYPEKISTGKYNTQLALKMINSHDITVLCSHPIYPDWKPEQSKSPLERINIIRGGLYLKYPKNPLFRRALLEIWFSIFTLKHLIFNIKKYNIIISIFPPNLASLVFGVIKSSHIKHIGIVHDIQGIMYVGSDHFLKKVLKKSIFLIEEKSYKTCDKLIFLSHNMKDLANNHYNLEKIQSSVCYPFITIKNFHEKAKTLDSIFTKKINIVYSGALGEKQLPLKIIQLFDKASKIDDDINFYIFSQGPTYENIKQKNQNQRILFYPLVEEEDLPELLIRSTVQLIPQNPQSSDGAFPSKLPNILASGTKIFCVTALNSEVDKLLSTYSKALVKHSWEDEDLALQMIKLAYAQTNLTDTDSQFLDQFHIEHLLNEIVDCDI